MDGKIKSISIIYGSDSGATEEIAKTIGRKLNVKNNLIKEVSRCNSEDFTKYNIIILGVSTWYIGDLQNDWDDYFAEFEKINFEGVDVCIFGLGDQYGYSYNYVDGIGILAEVIISNGGKVFGYWPNKGYEFDESRGIAANGMFYGLALDEDNQPELSQKRIEDWVVKIKDELGI